MSDRQRLSLLAVDVRSVVDVLQRQGDLLPSWQGPIVWRTNVKREMKSEIAVCIPIIVILLSFFFSFPKKKTFYPQCSPFRPESIAPLQQQAKKGKQKQVCCTPVMSGGGGGGGILEIKTTTRATDERLIWSSSDAYHALLMPRKQNGSGAWMYMPRSVRLRQNCMFRSYLSEFFF